VTVMVAVSMTEIDWESRLRTYAMLPFGLNAIDAGRLPTAIVPTTVFVAVFMTRIWLLPASAT
jgi:hypothetical protein